MYLSDITPDFLRETHLFGIDLTDPSGNPFPEIFYEQSIRKAIEWMHHETHLFFEPTTITDEMHDYVVQEWMQFGYLALHWFPVIEVTGMRGVFPRDNTIINIPLDWIILFKRPGQIQLVPTAGSMSSMVIGTGGQFISYHTTRYARIPGFWHVDYVTGFAAGELPEDIGDLIAKVATYNILNAAGDMIAGSAGVANYSIGVDGLSQSVGTTASPTNAGYGARLINYQREIKQQLKTLREYYQGFGMAVL